MRIILKTHRLAVFFCNTSFLEKGAKLQDAACGGPALSTTREAG